MTTLLALEPYQEALDRDWNMVGMCFVGVLILLILGAGVAGIVALFKWWIS